MTRKEVALFLKDKTSSSHDLFLALSHKLPNSTSAAIKGMLSIYFMELATNEMDKLFEQNGWGDDKIEEWAHTHMRTSYDVNSLER